MSETAAKLKTVNKNVIYVDTGNTGRHIDVSLVTNLGDVSVYKPCDERSGDEMVLYFVQDTNVIKVLNMNASYMGTVSQSLVDYHFQNISDIY